VERSLTRREPLTSLAAKKPAKLVAKADMPLTRREPLTSLAAKKPTKPVANVEKPLMRREPLTGSLAKKLAKPVVKADMPLMKDKIVQNILPLVIRHDMETFPLAVPMSLFASSGRRHYVKKKAAS
jgi:hypothetical protein